jgi:hypothetical protein
MRHEKNPKGFFELPGLGEMRHEKDSGESFAGRHCPLLY